jgi:hypothetical protein
MHEFPHVGVPKSLARNKLLKLCIKGRLSAETICPTKVERISDYSPSSGCKIANAADLFEMTAGDATVGSTAGQDAGVSSGALFKTHKIWSPIYPWPDGRAAAYAVILCNICVIAKSMYRTHHRLWFRPRVPYPQATRAPLRACSRLREKSRLTAATLSRDRL